MPTEGSSQNINHHVPKVCGIGLRAAIAAFEMRDPRDGTSNETRMREALEAYEKVRVPQTNEALQLVNGRIRLDLANSELYLDDVSDLPFDITPTCFNLLKYFMQNLDTPLSLSRLMMAVWGHATGCGVDGNDYVRVAVCKLRKIIEPDTTDPTYIHVKRGLGYIMHKVNTNA